MLRSRVPIAIHRALLAALATTPFAFASGCACSNTVIVVPLGDAGFRNGIYGSQTDRALTAAECAQLCGITVQRCQAVMPA